MKKIIFSIFFVLILIYQFGCDILDSENESNLSEIEVKVNNLPSRQDSSYVGWLTYVDASLADTIKTAAKIFTIQNGNFSERKAIDFGYLHDANSFIVTIVPDSISSDSTFAGVVAMYGHLSNNTINLNYVLNENPMPNPLPDGNVKIYIDVVK